MYRLFMRDTEIQFQSLDVYSMVKLSGMLCSYRYTVMCVWLSATQKLSLKMGWRKLIATGIKNRAEMSFLSEVF